MVGAAAVASVVRPRQSVVLGMDPRRQHPLSGPRRQPLHPWIFASVGAAAAAHHYRHLSRSAESLYVKDLQLEVALRLEAALRGMPENPWKKLDR